jgi:8-hydroxy-5-deazaflavin:NADPH oxidoreductase
VSTDAIDKVTIFGSGNMGTAIADLVRRGGAAVQQIGRGDTGARVTGDVVVLAVPHPAVEQVVAAYADQLVGRTVVDITNPLDFSTFDSLVVPADASKASELAAALPGAKVLKAFNTNFAATLGSGQVGEQPTTVLVAGDDAEAKQGLIDLVTAGGLRAVDAGSLKRARELEAVGFLQLTLAATEKVGWTGGFALVG